MKRIRVIRQAVKKMVAAAEGCCPGASIEIKCEYCRAPGRLAWLMPWSVVVLSANFEWDHDVPVSRGGNGEFGNVWPMCQSCNRKKRDHHPDYFPFVMWPELRELAPREWARVKAAYA